MTTRRSLIAGSTLVLLWRTAWARNDDGRYDNSPFKKWFDGLMIPGTQTSCCGEGDANRADEWVVDGDTWRVTITWEGERRVIDVNKQYVLLDKAWTNPTGHGILFTNPDRTHGFCFIPTAKA